MGIFGGEKYSKEGYKKAQHEAEKATENVSKTPGGRGQNELEKSSLFYQDFYGRQPPDLNRWVETSAGKIERKAHKKLAELLASGHKEAAALNEEYDHLLARAQEAIQAVADFEREKLGMHKEGAEEEADADKK